jgi:lipopolysaccharide assembly protein A
MTEPTPHTATLPPYSDNGAAPPTTPTPSAPTTAAPSASAAPRREPLRSRIGQVRTALIAGAVVLVLVLIFIIENAHTVTITYFGAHLRMSLAVALLLAAIAGALVMAAAGTARITQLRLSMRRSRRQPHEGQRL